MSEDGMLNVSDIEPDLNRLTALANTSADDSALLAAAKPVMARLRRAPSADDGATSHGWQGQRLESGPDTVDILCWHVETEATISTAWRGPFLEALLVRVGERACGMRRTPRGEAHWSGDGSAYGPADRRFDRLPERVQEEFERWRAARTPQWTCSRCSWENQDGVTFCEWCGVSHVTSAAVGEATTEDAFAWTDPPDGRPPVSIPRQSVITLPEGAAEMFESIGRELGRLRRGIETGVDVVVTAIAPNRRDALIEAVCEVRKGHTQRPNGRAEVSALLAVMPAVAVTGVERDEAQRVKAYFERAGASVDIRSTD